MATNKFTSSAISDDSNYNGEPSSYPLSKVIGKDADSTSQYCGITLNTGSGVESYFFLEFDVSEIPSNAKITSVTARARMYGSSNAQNRTSSRKLQLYSGTTPKGTAADWTATSATIYNVEDGGGWTRSELTNVRLKVSATRNSTQTTTSTQIYIMGADITVEWEEGGSDPEPGGGGESNKETTYNYTGGVQQVTLNPGRYKLECWGAQGGNYSSFVGGKGGYSVGILNLTEKTMLYIQVGGQPDTVSSSRSKVAGGYNGGGDGQNRYYSSQYTYGQGGGGATDIRIGQDDLYARVIVAGGGAGSASDNSSTKYGGGEHGGPGGASESATYVAGQTAPKTSGYYVAGTFGQGANAYTSRTDYQMGSGGGGGGWYGGYAYNYAQDSQTALRGYCGGGSGYVYTAATASNYPSGCLLNSNYYLEEAETFGGDTRHGNEGNGKVVITDITPVASNKFYVKVNGAWRKVAKVSRKVDGVWIEVSDVSEIFKDAQSGTNSGYFIDK